MSQNEFVCAHHRYTLGTNWRPSQLCQHLLHQGSTAKNAKRDVSTASWLVYKSIEKQFLREFPVGGLICTMHRCMEENTSNDDTDDTQLAPYPDFSPQTPTSLCNADTSKENLDSFIDTATDINPIKFQMMSLLEDYSVSTIRYAKRKWKQAEQSFKSKYCEMVAPGQAEKLAAIISSESDSDSDSTEVSKEMKDLIDAYNNVECDKQRIVILSLVSSENYSKVQIMELVGCTKHKVDMARKWRKIYAPLQQRKEEKHSRQKLNLEQANHVFEYLFGSNLIQDVAYGTTIIKYDSGERQMLPPAVIKTMRSHVIQEYKLLSFCQLLLQKAQYLSDYSLWRILRNIEPSQRRAMAGLDNITANVVKHSAIVIHIVLVFH